MSDVVEVSVDVAARPATVWRCVTQSDLLSRWLAAAVTLAPHVGGAVRIDFARYGTVVEGRVEEVRENQRLAFTWGVAAGPQAAEMPAGSTRVSIDLAEIPGGTRVTLRHAGLPTEKSRHEHTFGWTGYLGSLAGVAPIASVPGGPEALWDDWFGTWAETDAGRRNAALALRVADDATYRDVHADCRDRASISRWMAQCQAMFPGARVIRDGGVVQSRGSLLVRWHAEMPGGAVVGRGTNYGRLASDGRLAAVEAFWET